MARTIHTATRTYHFPGELVTPEERASLAEMMLPPELLHQCRFGRMEYDWRATAIVAPALSWRASASLLVSCPACARCMVGCLRSASLLLRSQSMSLQFLSMLVVAPPIPIVPSAAAHDVLQEPQERQEGRRNTI